MPAPERVPLRARRLADGGRGGGLVSGLLAAGVSGRSSDGPGSAVPAVDLLGYRLIEVSGVGQELAGGQAHEFGAVGVEPTGEGVERMRAPGAPRQDAAS
ncbi:hypothetical protein Pd630_LPD13016 (plasmid) [Rhodococcus opacus PD630]|nr:hypothetical protein Pd630_LPD13016 [Rhodococcus opacus PD630]